MTFVSLCPYGLSIFIVMYVSALIPVGYLTNILLQLC